MLVESDSPSIALYDSCIAHLVSKEAGKKQGYSVPGSFDQRVVAAVRDEGSNARMS